MAGASNESLQQTNREIERWAGSASPSLARELFAVLAVLDENGALRRALVDPSYEGGDRSKVVDRLFADKVSADAVEVLSTLAGRRWAHDRDFTDALEHAGVVLTAASAENRGGLPAVEEVVDQLIAFKSVLDSSHELQRALSDPRADVDAKTRLAHRLAPGASDEAMLLLEQAVLSPRGALVGRLIERFAEEVAARRKRLIAHVTTARPLTGTQEERLQEQLNALYGKELKLAVEVDPALIGGLKVQIGEEVIDGSVAARLDELRQRIKA